MRDNAKSQITDHGSRFTHHTTVTDRLQIRIHGDASLASLATLVYLPGIHGDWTLVSSFRAAMKDRVRFVEFTYPRTTSWSLDDYAKAIEAELLTRGIDRGWLLGESFGSQPAWQMVKHFLEKPAGGDESKSTGNAPLNRPPTNPSLTPPRKGTGQQVSLPSWEGLGVGPSIHSAATQIGFRPLGLILAGGFVRHPVIWAVRLAGRVSRAIPLRCVKLFCVAYARYARLRHRSAPETLASVAEFVANRTVEADRQAIVHRYTLIAENDLRTVARDTSLPVYGLAGSVDPLVPWCYVRWWLRRNCPGYRGGKMMWRADHNVLGTAPKASAELILRWMNGVTAGG
jgi:pimeloyl-ACP methyl ester carboxylesterase